MTEKPEGVDPQEWEMAQLLNSALRDVKPSLLVDEEYDPCDPPTLVGQYDLIKLARLLLERGAEIRKG